MLFLLHFIFVIHNFIFSLARNISFIALFLMVLVTLLQIFFRYVLNDALSWPDEAARFLMLWMVGLMAPCAFRYGGFVAIDLLPRALPVFLSRVLSLLLLFLCLLVLLSAFGYGYDHTFGFGGRFDSSSLRLPLDWFGYESIKVKLRYMYASLFVCVVLMISTNIELLLRILVSFFYADSSLPRLVSSEGHE